MNNTAYVPVRKGESSEWYQWEHASTCREQVDKNLATEKRKYGSLMDAWPLLRIAKIAAKEIKE
jgi:pyruvoyl-dependent arginine decarboxylase (PvlArgDC)